MKFKKEFSGAKTAEKLREIEIKFLGRKGALPLLLREIPKLEKSARAEIGKFGNEIRKNLETKIAAAKSKLQKSGGGNSAEIFDPTFKSENLPRGARHPISKLIEEIEDIFATLGFQSLRGDEIEDDWHNFEALNFPPDHPAREMQDTFFVKNLKNFVLRTQTSNMQIRKMENSAPPFQIISPGKTFRKDSDATHSPMFHQFEGLLIDENVSIANLKWILQTALSALFRKEIELRFRLSYFPFTEPSLEVDASCVLCGGENSKCKMCKGTGFLELGGAGIVHRNVLKNCGVDAEKWGGFAFGFGIERIFMIRHGVDDLRLFFENDLRFLGQF